MYCESPLGRQFFPELCYSVLPPSLYLLHGLKQEDRKIIFAITWAAKQHHGALRQTRRAPTMSSLERAILVFPKAGGLPWLTEFSAALRIKINMAQHSVRFLTHGVCANEPSELTDLLTQKATKTQRNCVMAKVTLVVALSMSCHLPVTKQIPQPRLCQAQQGRRKEAPTHQHKPTSTTENYSRVQVQEESKGQTRKMEAARHRSSKIYCSYKCW